MCGRLLPTFILIPLSSLSSLTVQVNTMRIIHLLPFILPAALAIPAPASQAQTLLSVYSDLAAFLLGNIAEGVRHFVHGPEQEVEKKVEHWVEDGRQFVRQNEIICKCVSGWAIVAYPGLTRGCGRRGRLAPAVF